jgi:hypothetical protein
VGWGGVLAETEEMGSRNCGEETTLEVEQLVRMGQEVSLNHINNSNGAVLVHIFSNFL